MSRVGKKSIVIPSNVTCNLDGSIVTFKGPLGTISINIPDGLKFKKQEPGICAENENSGQKKESFCFIEKDENFENSALWGTVAANVRNAINGVSVGFSKQMSLVGVGYKVQKIGNNLEFSLGYSHSIKFDVHPDIEVIVENPTKFSVRGKSKKTVGEVCSDIAKLRKVEPYKGKGVIIAGRFFERKEGKKK